MSEHPALQCLQPTNVVGLARRTASWPGAIALAGALALGACAEAPKAPPAAPAVASLQDYLEQGTRATTDGSRDKALEAYRSAAKAYPASKEPWVKLAQEYFAAGDYGNAITASQEVLQRDPADTVASSVLAVSGLRVSSAALQNLRSQSRIAGDTRSEAETMTRTLRDVLGEDVLVPTAKVAPKVRPRRTATAAAKPASGAASASAFASNGANPFDKLK